jgi:hypothetical protein
MFEIDVKKEGTGNDAKSEVIFKNRGAAATPAFMTINNTQDVTFGANVSIPNLIVSGTTTTINSTVTTYVDPVIELHTASGGGAPSSTTTKDVGISMNYHNGSAAKKAFAGWDDSAEKFIFVADATESGTQVISGTAGTIHANFTVPDDGTIGSASDSDAIAIASSGVVTFSQSPVIVGTTPKLTIGDAGAEDTMLVFDGNATDVRLGIDDSSDVFEIGTGTTHGTTPAISINTSQVCTFSANPVFPTGGVSIASLDIDGGTDIGAAIVDADLFIIDDGAGGANRKVTASRIKTYAGFDGALSGTDVDLSALSSGNNANTTLILGSTANECLNIIANTVTGAATLSSVNFISKTASTTANTGLMTFSVDEATAQLTIHDGGITATTITESSDTELKQNITPLEGSLDKIMALQGVNFDWKEGEDKQIGLLADDVAKIVPEFVQFEKRGRKKKAVALQYSKMVALLIEGMKEQQTEINKLKKLVSKSK